MLKSHTKRIKNIQKVALEKYFIESGQKYKNPKFSPIFNWLGMFPESLLLK